jgi:hypothetical protein
LVVQFQPVAQTGSQAQPVLSEVQQQRDSMETLRTVPMED